MSYSTTVAFRLNDAMSRQYVQGVFGHNRKKETYLSSIGTRGIVEQVHEANVVEDWDSTRLRIGEAIIGLPGQEPFLFRFDRFKPS